MLHAMLARCPRSAIIAIFWLFLFGAPAFAVQWHMATPYAEANFHTRNIRLFAEDVNKATGGRLAIVVHSNGALVRHAQIKRAVRGGQVEAGEFLLSGLANEDPVFQLDSLPFLVTGYPAARRLWEESRDTVSDLLARQGLVVLFAVPWPPQGLYSRRPLATASALSGARFRAYNSATERLARLLGAVPTQIEVPDIPQAFATGRIDAIMTSAATGVNSKAWDFVKVYYDIRAWLPKNIVVVNRRALSQLDAPDRAVLLEAAARAEARGWRMSEDENAEKLRRLRQSAMTVMVPGARLLGDLKRLGARLRREWEARAGEKGRTILKALCDNDQC